MINYYANQMANKVSLQITSKWSVGGSVMQHPIYANYPVGN